MATIFFLLYSYTGKFILSILLPLLFLSFGMLDIFLKEEYKGFPILGRFLIAAYVVFMGCNYVQAKYPNVCLHRYSYILNSEVEHILEESFQQYKAINYEDIPELSKHSVLIQHRLNKIPTEINQIDETQKEINVRYKNLHNREAEFKTIVRKINKREENAGDKITVFDLPKLENKELNLTYSYKRILTHAKQIEKNIEEPACSIKCTFYLIDQSSFNIIREIDNIRTNQDIVLLYLTNTEKKYNALQKQQISIENNLTKRNY